jgi:hypothetical protein
VITLGVGAYWAVSVPGKTTSKVYSPPTQAQQQAGAKAKQQAENNTNQTPGTSSTQNPLSTQPATTPTTKPTVVNLVFSALNQTTNTLQIRTDIESAVTNQGSCSLILTNGNQTFNQTATVEALASFSTCQGFDVPLTSLSSGNWTVKVNFSDPSQNLTGSVSSIITIKQ